LGGVAEGAGDDVGVAEGMGVVESAGETGEDMAVLALVK
jgi:hypothetical protein